MRGHNHPERLNRAGTYSAVRLSVNISKLQSVCHEHIVLAMRQLYKQTQTGFGHVGLILIILLVLGVIGFGAWRIYQANISKLDTSNAGESISYIDWGFNGSEWKAAGDAPACDEPLTVASPMDASKATQVLYPGQVRGGDYKPHGGLAVDTGDSHVAVAAVIDAYLYRGSRYMQDGTTQYMFDFLAPCGVMYRLDHLRVLTPEFQAVADTLPPAQPDDSRTYQLNHTFIKKGTQIATEIGIGQNTFLDFGLYDLRKQNEASKNPSFATEPLRLSDKEQSFYALCWFNNLTGTDKTIISGLPARGATVEGKVSDYCK